MPVQSEVRKLGYRHRLCGLASHGGRVHRELAHQRMTVLVTPYLLAVFARRGHERFGVVSGRAIRMDLNNTDVALMEILRVLYTCCLLE